MYTHKGAGWTIRPYASGDGSACVAIFRNCLSDFPWRGDWRAFLPPLHSALVNARALVAVEPRAGVVGFLTMQAPSAYVDHLFVDEDWRFCGIAGGLLEVARREARKPLTLDVDAENQAARKAYQALGWSAMAETRQAPHGPQLRLISE